MEVGRDQIQSLMHPALSRVRARMPDGAEVKYRFVGCTTYVELSLFWCGTERRVYFRLIGSAKGKLRIGEGARSPGLLCMLGSDEVEFYLQVLVPEACVQTPNNLTMYGLPEAFNDWLYRVVLGMWREVTTFCVLRGACRNKFWLHVRMATPHEDYTEATDLVVVSWFRRFRVQVKGPAARSEARDKRIHGYVYVWVDLGEIPQVTGDELSKFIQRLSTGQAELILAAHKK